MKSAVKYKDLYFYLIIAGLAIFFSTPVVVFGLFYLSALHCEMNNCELGMIGYFISTFFFGVVWAIIGVIVLIAGIIKYFMERKSKNAPSHQVGK